MSTKFTCDDKQALIAYLYGEIDPDSRAGIEVHLATCARCASEVAALGDVRAELGLWQPPDAELGFTIVRTPPQPASRVVRPARWWQQVPAWAQAAAAILVVTAGLSLANLQVRSGPDGFVVTTGWMAAQDAPTAAGIGEVAATPDEAWRPALVALEQQLRSEIRATRAQPAAALRVSNPADESTIRRVQQLLAESEQRQERELALRLTQFTREMDRQRRADLARIGYGLTQFDEQMFRQRQMLNNVIRVSGVPQQ